MSWPFTFRSNSTANSENNTANSSEQNNVNANDANTVTNNEDNNNNNNDDVVNNDDDNNNLDTNDDINSDIANNDDINSDIANNDENANNVENATNQENNTDSNNSDVDICGNTAALREEALTSGTTHYNGVTELSESISLSILNGDDGYLYENRLVQVEGIAIHICAGSGVRTMLADYEENEINVEGAAGTIDLRETLMIGQYVVAEGIFSAAGGHGAQLLMENYGAMSSETACQPPSEYEEDHSNNEENSEH